MAVMIMGSKGRWQVWSCGRWSTPMSKREAISLMAMILLKNGKKEAIHG